MGNKKESVNYMDFDPYLVHQRNEAMLKVVN
jgi:hypothetical protein